MSFGGRELMVFLDIALVVLVVAFFITHFQNVKRVKHIERILVKQFGNADKL